MATGRIMGKVVGRLAAAVVLAGACLFGSAGTFRWWNGWVFLVAYAALAAVMGGALFRRSPDLLEERMTARARAKDWDKVLMPVVAVILPLVSLVLCGLDRRLAWTRSISDLVSVLAFALMVGSTSWTYWAMRSNPFFSSHVRIQTDRGHVVVSDGPYRFVRHPGYAGALVYNLAAPVMLGSLVALGVGVVIVALLVLRTALEDRTLQAELAGYPEYARRVPYRLVPFVW